MKKTLCLLLALVLTLSALGLTGCKKENAAAAHTFTLEVTDLDGKVTKHEISTDKQTVGEALLEQGLISGDVGDYGLYVKTVDGMTADYDADGLYWAFYKSGEYLMTGVDTTEIADGEQYELVCTAA